MLHLAHARRPSSPLRVLAALAVVVLAGAFALLAAPRPAHAINVLLEWTATGDDSTFGQAVEYDLRYSFKPYFPNRFNDADRWTNVPAPGPAGTLEHAIIEDLAEETVYYFAVKAKDERGNWSKISNIVAITPTVGADGVEHWKLAFSEATPSPARTNTKFAFSLPAKGRAHVEAVDVSGRRVRTLLDGEMAPGPHDLEWNLRDDEGQPVRPGVYFVRANVSGTAFRRRVVVVN